MFHEGQKVICVEDDFIIPGWALGLNINFPVKGQIYTIKAIYVYPHHDETYYGFVLHEIVNKWFPFLSVSNGQPTFSSECFRPLEEQKTDISVFTQILDKLSLTKKRECV